MNTVTLDGAAAPLLKPRLAERIKKVLETAKTWKQMGIGVMARPEADLGLLQLFQVLERLEPGRGWLEKAIITATHTLHHCLSQPQHVSWGLSWRYYLGHKKSEMEPSSLDPSLLQDAEALFSPSRSVAITLLPLLRQYLDATDVLVGKSFEKNIPSLVIPPLPTGLPEPEWRNLEDLSRWPVAGKAAKMKLGRVLTTTMASWAGDAWTILKWGESILQGEPQTHGTPKAQFLALITFDNVSAKFAEVAYLDRVFGGSAEGFIKALYGYSRFQHYQEIWDERVHYFHAHVPTALAVNDFNHLQHWAGQMLKEKMPQGGQTIRLYLKIILKDSDVKISPLPKGSNSYFGAECLALQGLLDGQPDMINEGITGMLAGYAKTNHPVWAGKWLSEICIPAIAIQRAAIRSGIKIIIPQEKPNDPELVHLPDPIEPALLYCLYPGIEMLLSHENLEWPTLLINEPIKTVIGFTKN